MWADLTRLLLNLQAAPESALGTVQCSNGAGAVLDPAAVKARREVLEGTDEAVAAFVKLGDVEGIHNSAVLAWNAGALALLMTRGNSCGTLGRLLTFGRVTATQHLVCTCRILLTGPRLIQNVSISLCCKKDTAVVAFGC